MKTQEPSNIQALNNDFSDKLKAAAYRKHFLQTQSAK